MNCAILGVFADAKQRFEVHLLPEDVAERLTEHHDVEAVTATLDQLVAWDNLRPYPDTSRLTTVEDFNRRRHVYALTPHGEAAEAALATYADVLGRRGELQAVALSDIRVAVRSLEQLAHADDVDAGRAAAALRDLETVFRGLADNAAAMATVQRGIDRSHAEVDAFLAYKNRLIGSLDRFIGDLVVASGEIAAVLGRLDELDVDRLLAAVARRETADAARERRRRTVTSTMRSRRGCGSCGRAGRGCGGGSSGTAIILRRPPCCVDAAARRSRRCWTRSARSTSAVPAVATAPRTSARWRGGSPRRRATPTRTVS